MPYQTLEKLLHKDSSSSRFAANEQLARERLESESTFRTGIELSTGELFLAVPRELSLLNETILRKERRVSALWRALPPVALGSFLRNLILDEVLLSNKLEGVRSTRRQIETALEAAHKNNTHVPFAEFARLYLNLGENPRKPETLQDVRALYDAVVSGTLDADDELGDSLFRHDDVHVMDTHGREIHRGIAPERIPAMMRQLLDLMHNENLPETYCALLCHFVFEYIHPFFDGNGRTGRYLLALQLNEPLSQPTVLSLSRVIVEHKDAYYRAFTTTEKKLNHAEATHFVLTLLELIGIAQDELIAELENKQEALFALDKRIKQLEKNADYDGRLCDTLFYAGQMHLFDAENSIRLIDAASYLRTSKQTASRTLARLHEAEYLVRVSHRPLVYRLSDAGKQLLFSTSG